MLDAVQGHGHQILLEFPDSTKIRATAILFAKGCKMGMTVELRQPSAAIADVFAELAFWPENVVYLVPFNTLLRLTLICSLAGLSTSMLEWSSVISVSSPLF